MNLRDSASRKPVEFTSALAMVVAGVYLSGTATAGTAVVIIGNLLSALGGALLSWSTVSLSSKEAAADILRPQLAAIARQLVTVSGQISKAVHDAKNDDLDESVALEMVSQASRIMYASVNEIHVVLNQKVDAQELLDTAQRIEDLATRLAEHSPSAQDEIESELMNAVAELQVQIQAIAPASANRVTPRPKKTIPKAGPRELEIASTMCPSCGVAMPVSIGPAFGSSAMPTCGGCGLTFHAHRAHDGTVISKTPGQKFAPSAPPET